MSRCGNVKRMYFHKNLVFVEFDRVADLADLYTLNSGRLHELECVKRTMITGKFSELSFQRIKNDSSSTPFENWKGTKMITPSVIFALKASRKHYGKGFMKIAIINLTFVCCTLIWSSWKINRRVQSLWLACFSTRWQERNRGLVLHQFRHWVSQVSLPETATRSNDLSGRNHSHLRNDGFLRNTYGWQVTKNETVFWNIVIKSCSEISAIELMKQLQRLFSTRR